MALPVGVIVLLLFGACSSDDDEVLPTPAATSELTATADAPAPQGNDRFMYDVSNAVPGFTGFSADAATSTINIYTTDTAIDEGQLRAALARNVQGFDQYDGWSFHFIPAEYSFAQLWEWYGGLWTRILEVPGAISTDIQEAGGWIQIGIETEEARQPVQDIFEEAGVPSSAYRIVIEEPPVQLTDG